MDNRHLPFPLKLPSYHPYIRAIVHVQNRGPKGQERAPLRLSSSLNLRYSGVLKGEFDVRDGTKGTAVILRILVIAIVIKHLRPQNVPRSSFEHADNRASTA